MPTPLSVLDLVPVGTGTTAADTLTITSMIHSHAARLRSYELVARAWGMPHAKS